MQIRQVKAYLNSLVVDRFAYIDRVNIWLDTNRPVVSQKTIQAFHLSNRKIEIVNWPMSKFQPSWKQKLQLHQPTPELLKLVEDDIHRASCNYVINRVELAVDWITETAANADAMHLFLQTHFVHCSSMSYHFENEYKTPTCMGTSYFAQKKKHKIVPVIYTDKVSKVNREPCAHFEYRLTDTGTCRAKEILTLDDLIVYDIIAFFTDHVEFHKKPTKEEIGKALRHNKEQDDPQLSISKSNSNGKSRRSFEKLCERFLVKIGTDYDELCLQELHQLIPKLKSHYDSSDKSLQTTIVKSLFA